MAAAFLFLASCNTLRTRGDIENDRTGVSKSETQSNGGTAQSPRYDQPQTPPPAPNVEIPLAASPIPAMPKIGLIFGPGGARAYGHIGFLQNMARMKVPVYGTVGIEWGAPVAALLSSKGQVYDVEWQMFKLKDDDLVKKSLIGSGGRVTDVTALKDFFQTAFANQKVEGFKYPFACPAYNIAKNQVYMMSRGSVDNLMPYCVPYPPTLKPFNRNVSAVRELKMASDFLRSQGANYIVLVNVLGRDGGRKSLVKDADSTDSVTWSEISSFYSKPHPGIDATIPIDLDNYLVTDFEKKREIMQKGAEVSQKPLEAWARKLGF
ncbi:MAG: alpha/beta hydrolase [Bdellovibrionaceae bacterium]|nr:alpha/beta hydrolase [Pseudobdellovibrionaceae bacterium]